MEGTSEAVRYTRARNGGGSRRWELASDWRRV